MMESYLMMLYVTLEQEAALKNFFIDQGWSFCKPDLSVTTEKLGPATCFRPNNARNEQLDSCMWHSSEQLGKRKPQCTQSSSFNSKPPKLTKSSEIDIDKSLDSIEDNQNTNPDDSEMHTEKTMSPITVQGIDGTSTTIKVELADDDDPSESSYKDFSERTDANGDEDDDTDVDYSFGEASGILDDSEMGTSFKEDTSLIDEVNDDDFKAGSSKPRKEMTAEQIGNQEFYPFEKSFTYSPGLNYHLHHGIKPAVKCTFCHKTFTTIAAKKRHERTVHAAEKKFKCDDCDERFAFKWLMEAHAARKHGTGKLFNCACGALFNRQSNLTQHMSICETTQKPGNERVCNICRKTFKCKKYLDVHMKFQHDVSTLPSVCGICGESFTRPWSLTRHVKRQHSVTESSNTDS